MITVEGYSGCEVRIVKKGPCDYVVEKGSNDPKYVPRLLKQRDKQLAAHASNTFDNVVIPKILYTKLLMHEVHGDGPLSSPTSSTCTPTACVIGMPFYHHTDSITFLTKASMDDVKMFSSCLLDTIDMNLRVCQRDVSIAATCSSKGVSGTSTPQPHAGASPSLPPMASPLPPPPSAAHITHIGSGAQYTSACDVKIFIDKLEDIVKVCTSNAQLQAMEADGERKAHIGGDGSLGPLARIRDVIIPALTRYLRAKAVPKTTEAGAPMDAIYIPMGACHGDFTLSNVLILTPHPNEPTLSFTVPIHIDPVTGATSSVTSPLTGGASGTPSAHESTSNHPGAVHLLSPGTPFKRSGFRIALIDFLDSFVESPLADMAKICQDLKYGWTLRLLSTPKKDLTVDGNGNANATAGTSFKPKTAEEKAIYTKLSEMDSRKPSPVSDAAAKRRKALLQSTAKEILRDTAANQSSSDSFAESLQAGAVQVFAAMHHIYEEMLVRYGRHQWFRDYFLVFFIMNQLRVLQYSKDTDAGLYLYRSVEEEFKLFMQNEGAAVA